MIGQVEERLVERDFKSPEEDLTGEKTITASLQVWFQNMKYNYVSYVNNVIK